jgi:hypothetical protein
MSFCRWLECVLATAALNQTRPEIASDIRLMACAENGAGE